MKVNICGIPHTVIVCEDHFDVDTHFGQIDYKACEIRINKDLSTEAMGETICHEMIHGILVHLGYSAQSQDETFVQALGNAIYQGFVVRVIEERDNNDTLRNHSKRKIPHLRKMQMGRRCKKGFMAVERRGKR